MVVIDDDVDGQVAGAHGDQMGHVAELLRNETKIDFVDLNLGCPIDIVCQRGWSCRFDHLLTN